MGIFIAFILGLGLGLAFHFRRTREMRKGGGACFARNTSLDKRNQTLERENETLKSSNRILRWENETTNKTNAELRVENGKLERQITKNLNAISELKGQLLVLQNLTNRVERQIDSRLELPSSVGKPTAPFTAPLTEALAKTLTLRSVTRVTEQLAARAA